MEATEARAPWSCGPGCVGLRKHNISTNDKYTNTRLVENGRIYLRSNQSENVSRCSLFSFAM